MLNVYFHHIIGRLVNPNFFRGGGVKYFGTSNGGWTRGGSKNLLKFFMAIIFVE